jgi:hypothetical protein
MSLCTTYDKATIRFRFVYLRHRVLSVNCDSCFAFVCSIMASVELANQFYTISLDYRLLFDNIHRLPYYSHDHLADIEMTMIIHSIVCLKDLKWNQSWTVKDRAFVVHQRSMSFEIDWSPRWIRRSIENMRRRHESNHSYTNVYFHNRDEGSIRTEYQELEYKQKQVINSCFIHSDKQLDH